MASVSLRESLRDALAQSCHRVLEIFESWDFDGDRTITLREVCVCVQQAQAM